MKCDPGVAKSFDVYSCLVWCVVVIVGKTKSLDFLEEQKTAKNNKSEAAAEQKQQQFQ